MAKVTIIGSGAVGSTTAHWIASKGLADVVLIDIIEGVPQGKALDLAEAMPIEDIDVKIKGTNDYSEAKGSDVIVITAGMPRKPGMLRDDLLNINSKIINDIADKIKVVAPDSILIVVTNPMDAMVYKAWQSAGFPKERVIGMAGVLDSARFRYFIAEELGVSFKDVHAMVLGGHGDTMVPMVRLARIGGLPVTDFLSNSEIERIVERTRNSGGEIVNLLKTGSTSYAPARAITEMIEAILLDRKRVLPCAAYCDKEYGAGGLFIGVPIVLGRQGVEKIIEIKMTDAEKAEMDKTIEHVRSLVKGMEVIVSK